MTQALSYQDFDLEIAPGDGDAYPVAVLRSPSGQARGVMRFPFERTELDRRLAASGNALQGETDEDAAQIVQRFGSQLFDALMGGQVRSVFDMSRQATRANNQGLRIKLRVNAPELATVPWEFLYDQRQGEFIALSRHTPIVRYQELPLPDADMIVATPLRLLGLIANPSGLPPLDVGQEKARFEAAIGDLQKRGVVELVWLEGQTWRDLQAAMQSGPWHIFHFVGHGMAAEDDADEGVLLLADEYGDPLPLSATQLGRLLADHRTLRLALLNACEGARGHEAGIFSSIASVLVRRGLPAVLAMQYEISDRAAIEFTSSFYQALAASLPIDAATSEARKSISLAEPGSIEWGAPALFMRAPDGLIWRVEQDGRDLSADQGQVWWNRLPDTTGEFQAGDVGGDVIIATLGAGARNVVVGKNNVQTITEILGEPTPDDKGLIEESLAQVRAMLKAAEDEIGAGVARMANGMLAQIENELLKTGQDETPNAAIITQMGDLLLDSVSQISGALADMFATPAVGRMLAKAGEAAVLWARGRFGPGST